MQKYRPHYEELASRRSPENGGVSRVYTHYGHDVAEDSPSENGSSNEEFADLLPVRDE